MTVLHNGETQSRSRITLFPDSFPDELHASQAGRLHLDSGNLSTQHTFFEAYGARPFRLTQWIPSHIEAFAQGLPGDPAINLQNLLRNNTLYPLLEVFGNARYTVESSPEERQIQISRMQKRLVGESGTTRLCIACLMQDRGEHGTPYIHRSHQIPGVNVCWRHNFRLLDACPYCACPFEAKADMVLAPWLPCAGCRKLLCDSPFYPPEHGNEQECAYAVFAHELLQTGPGPLSGDILASLYARKLREIGFARGTLVDRIGARQEIEAHYGEAFMERVDSAIRKGKDRQWVRSFSRSGMHDTPVSRHLLLANFLFGSAAQFTVAAQHMVASDLVIADAKTSNAIAKTRSPIAPNMATKTIDHAPPEPNSIDNTPLTKATAKIVAFLSQYPQASIANLWEQHRGAMGRIARSCTIDDRWLAQLKAAAASPAGPAEEILQSSPKDLEFAKKIVAEALVQLASIKKPIRMTRSFLLRQIGWKQGGFVPPTSYPLTDKQLDKEVESEWHYYARRIVWAILDLGEQASASPWRVIESSGVEYHRAKLLCAFFSGVSPRRTLRPGTITEVLGEFQVPLNWEGPAPDQKFRPRGRKHQRMSQTQATAVFPAREAGQYPMSHVCSNWATS